MPGPLDHSPAMILAEILISNEKCDRPPATLTLSPSNNLPFVFVGKEPDGPGIPDRVVSVFNTTGLEFGRDAFGELAEYEGVQLRVRHSTGEQAFVLMKDLSIHLDQLYMKTLTIGSSSYRVQSVRRSGGFALFGKEPSATLRNVMTMNAVMTVRKLS